MINRDPPFRERERKARTPPCVSADSRRIPFCPPCFERASSALLSGPDLSGFRLAIVSIPLIASTVRDLRVMMVVSGKGV